jgi:hypothetical protein
LYPTRLDGTHTGDPVAAGGEEQVERAGGVHGAQAGFFRTSVRSGTTPDSPG